MNYKNTLPAYACAHRLLYTVLLTFWLCAASGSVASAALIHLEHATLDPQLLPRVPDQPAHQAVPTRRGTAAYLVQARGPIVASWKEQVQQAGGVLRGYMPDNAFLVELTPAALAAVAALPDVAWIGAYAPAYKLSLGLQNPRRLRQRAAGASNQCEIVVQTLAREDVADVCAAIAVSGGTVVATANEYDGLVRAVVNQTALVPLAARAEVTWIEPYVPPKLLNNIAVQTPRMNVQTVWTNYGLTGKGQVIAVCDTGLDTGVNTSALHPDFTNRVKIAFARARASWSDPNGHGTHTCGSVLGNGSASGGQFRGCAYEAQLVMQSVMDASGSLSGLPSDLNVLFYQTYTNGARIHSDSWGSATDGAYDTSARQADQFMWNYKDMLLVFAAGNEGIDSTGNGTIDPYSVDSPGTAKNVLTVGAAETQRTSGGYSSYTWYDAWPADYPANPIKSDYISRPYDGVHQGIAAFSSRGPCSDSRVKPDIVAPGTDIISCRSRAVGAGTGWGVYNSFYVYMGGTSMATPLTAGAAGLARQYLIERRGIANPSAALLKALLVNGARSLSPGQYGTGPTREIRSGARPNNVEGWGQVNLADTLYPADGRTSVLYDAFSATTSTSTIMQFVASTNSKLCITLAWTDYPATAGAGIKLVNDLDLTVQTPEGEWLYPNGPGTVDHLNNVEGIDIPATSSGTYTIVIHGYNVPNGPQPYALVLREDAPLSAPHLQLPQTNVTIYTAAGETNSAPLIINNTGTAPLTYTLAKTLAGNYAARTSFQTGGPTFAWFDIATSGTTVPLLDDAVSSMIPLGFSFTLYGQTFSHFEIAANGCVALAAGGVPADNTTLPTSLTPDPLLAAFWDDLDPGSGGAVKYLTTPTNAIVSWLSVPRYGASSETQTFQIVIFADGHLLYQYRSVVGTLKSCTIGLQASSAGPALQLAYNQVYLANTLAVRITPPDANAWLWFAPTNGTIAAGAQALITCYGSGVDLTDGVYTAAVSLAHDDPLQTSKSITVALVVPEPVALPLLCLGVLWRLRRRGTQR